MKALTLWRPWPSMIFDLPADRAKRVENRSWRPPESIIGQRIAIHAGEKADKESMRVCAELLRQRAVDRSNGFPTRALETGLIGTVRVVGVTDGLEVDTRMFERIIGVEAVTLDDVIWHAQVCRWFSGPVGWLLDDVQRLPEPIPCKGRQGLWDVPPELLERLG